MNTDTHRVEVNEVTETIIGCAFKVSSGLGVGFLEKVYENALYHELSKTDLEARRQAPLKVQYDGVVVGEYFADLLINDLVVVELKHARTIEDAHIAQCIN